MPQIEHPQKRWTISGGVRSPKEPQVWDVGVRVSNAIWNYKNHERTAEKEMASVQGAHSSPRPHVRAAHWHTFWVGPRSAKFPDRKPIIRWLPPIPIGMEEERASHQHSYGFGKLIPEPKQKNKPAVRLV